MVAMESNREPWFGECGVRFWHNHSRVTKNWQLLWNSGSAINCKHWRSDHRSCIRLLYWLVLPVVLSIVSHHSLDTQILVWTSIFPHQFLQTLVWILHSQKHKLNVWFMCIDYTRMYTFNQKIKGFLLMMVAVALLFFFTHPSPFG